MCVCVRMYVCMQIEKEEEMKMENVCTTGNHYNSHGVPYNMEVSLVPSTRLR